MPTGNGKGCLPGRKVVWIFRQSVEKAFSPFIMVFPRTQLYSPQHRMLYGVETVPLCHVILLLWLQRQAAAVAVCPS